MNALALPTRHDEAYRYTDLDALAGVWPVAREVLRVPAGEAVARAIVISGEAAVARHLVVDLAPGATCDLSLLNLAERFGRIAVEVRLDAGARFTLGAAQIGGGEATLEIVTEVTHAAPDAVSRQTLRSVLAGTATGSYLGKVVVARGANGTDAAQSVRAMLLTRGATANAKPELEIEADDVKCAHGCAVGELDASALFYLASRGLPPASAKRLMLQAFLAEAFAGAAEEEALSGKALERLEALL